MASRNGVSVVRILAVEAGEVFALSCLVLHEESNSAERVATLLIRGVWR